MMKSALLFYRKLAADLLSLGFEINPYNPCVANKIINGKQMTICWHVDDLFIGHVDPTIVTSFPDWLAQRYDTDDKKLNVVRGHKHVYLGMNLDFSTSGAVQIDRIPYIKKNQWRFPRKNYGGASYSCWWLSLSSLISHTANFLIWRTSQGFSPHDSTTSFTLTRSSGHPNYGCNLNHARQMSW